MKIYTKIVMRMSDYEILEEESYEWDGHIAECKGGGTTTTSVPEWQKPYLEDVYKRAGTQVTQPIDYYSGQRVAGFTPEQSTAQYLTTQRALQGSPVAGLGRQGMMETLAGSYMDPSSNPWLAKTYQTAAGEATKAFAEGTMPQIRSSAMGTGAYGGARHGVAEGMAMREYGKTLGDMATGIYGPAYETERARQYQAQTGAPAYAATEYEDIGKLSAVGEERQAMGQALIDELIKQFEFGQMEPWQRLGMYSNLITGNVGGTTYSSGGK